MIVSYNKEPLVLNGHNYGMLARDIETLLKSKAPLWQFIKTTVINPKDEHSKFIINGNKDEAVGVMMTYISREICFIQARLIAE